MIFTKGEHLQMINSNAMFHRSRQTLSMALALLRIAVLLVFPVSSKSEPWPIRDQPDLKQKLENAPLLQTESLGEPARGVNVWERWFVPNVDGKSWDLLQIYFKEYYGPVSYTHLR